MRKQTKIAALVSAAALLAIGASMTSFAAGWKTTPEGDEYYEDSYGDRVTGVWRIRNGKYYYLDDETGLVKKSELFTDSAGVTYYVGSSGARGSAGWIWWPNDTEETAYNNEDEIPDGFYYWVQDGGKIFKANSGEVAAKDVAKSNSTTKKGKFAFDDAGHMLTGWVDRTYYCEPTEDNEDYVLGEIAVKAWRQLDIPQDDLDALANANKEDDDGVAYYYFQANSGKLQGAGFKYIDGYWYHFNEYCMMDEDTWVSPDPNTPSNASNPAAVYIDANGTAKSSAHWHKDSSGTWYYMVSAKVGNTTRRGLAFGKDNDKANDKCGNNFYIKVIDKNVYAFRQNGKIVTKAAITIKKGSTPKEWLGIATDYDKVVAGNTYYFDGDGHMVTKQQVVTATTDDGEKTYAYASADGALVKKTILADNVLYVMEEDADYATRVEVEEGEMYAVTGFNIDASIPIWTKGALTNSSTNAVKNSSYKEFSVITNKDGKLVKNRKVVIGDVEYKTDGNGLVKEIDGESLEVKK